jgi:hypothetical protein
MRNVTKHSSQKNSRRNVGKPAYGRTYVEAARGYFREMNHIDNNGPFVGIDQHGAFEVQEGIVRSVMDDDRGNVWINVEYWVPGQPNQSILKKIQVYGPAVDAVLGTTKLTAEDLAAYSAAHA